ncbi:MAG TPA: hypothetical protein EYH22_00700 [Candidatus Nanopusillus sp.]|nr:hypothetical protein [Candidatus Nanopusillus sp.]
MWVLDDNIQKIINAIAEKDTFTEKELKKKLKIKENEIRKVLYRLHELGVVYPIKTVVIKEGKYDYEWGARINDIEEIYKIIVERELEKLEKEKSSLPEMVYMCEYCDLQFDFDKAEEYDFKCPECGSILMPKRNLRICEIEETIQRLKDLLVKARQLKLQITN